MPPKIVTLDIETAPLECYTWGIRKTYVDLGQLKTDWSILSYSAKELGKDKVTFECTGGRGAKRVRDDKILMPGLWKILDEADIVVAQNGISFDRKKVNSRLAFHGFKPPSPVRMVDTLRESRKVFGFTSHKLAYMSRHLTPDTEKSEHKKFPGLSLWLECLRDNAAAWREMKYYNCRDVVATEKLFIKIRPWIANYPNIGAYGDAEIRECPKCGSENLQSRGRSVKQGGSYARLQCQDCGGWSRGKTNLLTTDKRTSLMVSE